jgi:hypothetical protein
VLRLLPTPPLRRHGWVALPGLAARHRAVAACPPREMRRDCAVWRDREDARARSSPLRRARRGSATKASGLPSWRRRRRSAAAGCSPRGGQLRSDAGHAHAAIRCRLAQPCSAAAGAHAPARRQALARRTSSAEGHAPCCRGENASALGECPRCESRTPPNPLLAQRGSDPCWGSEDSGSSSSPPARHLCP